MNKALRGSQEGIIMKGLKHLDYAVYGKLIVPMILLDTGSLMQIIDDSEEGKCRIVCRPRGRVKKVK
ncbi:hypothetical protein D3C78_1842600 [compost metagenome]